MPLFLTALPLEFSKSCCFPSLLSFLLAFIQFGLLLTLIVLLRIDGYVGYAVPQHQPLGKHYLVEFFLLFREKGLLDDGRPSSFLKNAHFILFFIITDMFSDFFQDVIPLLHSFNGLLPLGCPGHFLKNLVWDRSSRIFDYCTVLQEHHGHCPDFRS